MFSNRYEIRHTKSSQYRTVNGTEQQSLQAVVTDCSPAELLVGRKLRTKVPVTEDKLGAGEEQFGEE